MNLGAFAVATISIPAPGIHGNSTSFVGTLSRRANLFIKFQLKYFSDPTRRSLSFSKTLLGIIVKYISGPITLIGLNYDVIKDSIGS